MRTTIILNAYTICIKRKLCKIRIAIKQKPWQKTSLYIDGRVEFFILLKYKWKQKAFSKGRKDRHLTSSSLYWFPILDRSTHIIHRFCQERQNVLTDVQCFAAMYWDWNPAWDSETEMAFMWVPDGHEQNEFQHLF